MKLLVTGVCGRLGRAIATVASEQGHSVVGLDRVPWPAEKSSAPKGVEVVAGTYEDFALMERLLPGCDALLHTAGPHGADIKKMSLGDFIHSNVESVARVLELAVKAGVRGVALSSTMEVQIGRDWGTSGMAVVDEDSAPTCDSAYSISRLLVEHLGREFCRTNQISIASLRYMAFGYGNDRKLGPNLLARSISVRDVARAVIRAGTIGGLKGDVFNIGPKTPLTNQDIVAAQSDPGAVLEKYWPGAVEVLKANGFKLSGEHFWPATSIRKARLILGWEPEYTFEVWLTEHGWKRKD
jgi:nucleoside-diphosphate-sugar epimerase